MNTDFELGNQNGEEQEEIEDELYDNNMGQNNTSNAAIFSVNEITKYFAQNGAENGQVTRGKHSINQSVQSF